MWVYKSVAILLLVYRFLVILVPSISWDCGIIRLVSHVLFVYVAVQIEMYLSRFINVDFNEDL